MQTLGPKNGKFYTSEEITNTVHQRYSGEDPDSVDTYACELEDMEIRPIDNEDLNIVADQIYPVWKVLNSKD